MPVETAMISVVAQAPYRICKRLSGAVSSHAWRNGTRLGRWERTRSITTLRGQGRNTVRAASRIMAKPAQPSGLRKGRRSGRKFCAQILAVLGLVKLGKVPLLLSASRVTKRKLESPYSSFNPEECPASRGGFDQTTKQPFGSVPPQQLGLVVHSRVTILDVERVDIHDRSGIFKTKAEHQAFGPAVAGTKGEISNAVENWAAAVDFKSLDDMRMMAHHGVSATVDGEKSFGPGSGRRLGIVGPSPMECDHHPIHLPSEFANIAFQFFEDSHRAARKPCRSGTASIPVVAQQSNSQSSRFADDRFMSGLLVGRCAQGGHTGNGKRLQRLQYPIPSTIHQMVVRQRHHIDSGSQQRACQLRFHAVREISI